MSDFQKIRSETMADGAALAKAMPETIRAFSGLLQAATKDGALSLKTKELIALAIGVTAHCDGCLAHHAHTLFKAGASREEIVEAVGVAIAMGGGPAAVYAARALRAYDAAASS